MIMTALLKAMGLRWALTMALLNVMDSRMEQTTAPHSNLDSLRADWKAHH